MTALTKNTNFLTPSGFKLKIESGDFTNTSYTVVSAALPSVTLPEISSQFRNLQGFVPGDKVIYSPFNVRMLVNEDMENYQEILNWILANQKSEKIIKADISLTIMSSHFNPNKRIVYSNAFPTSISGFEFSVQNNDSDYAQCDVEFQYDYFKLA